MPVHAFIFPGQGSQSVGMGRDLAAAFAAAREVFGEVDDTLNQKIWSKRVDRDLAASYKERFRVISDKLIAGKPTLHVYADEQPEAGFEAVPPDLEDVYFSYIVGHLTVSQTI